MTMLPQTTFRYHIDPAHGWLEVHFSELKRLSFNPTEFSRCSYRHGNTFYLEEDCDAPKFITAWEKRYGCKARFVEILSNASSFIRNLPPIY